MTKYLIAALAAAALMCCGWAAYEQSAATALRLTLTETEADLADAQSDLAIAEARRVGAEIAHREMLQVLAQERRQSDDAQRLIETLRDRIARDAGTDRDGPTAPVLENAVRGLAKTSFEAQTPVVPEVWTFVSVVAGHVEKVIEIPSEGLCLALVEVAIADITSRPEYADHLRGHVTVTCSEGAPRRSA